MPLGLWGCGRGWVGTGSPRSISFGIHSCCLLGAVSILTSLRLPGWCRPTSEVSCSFQRCGSDHSFFPGGKGTPRIPKQRYSGRPPRLFLAAKRRGVGIPVPASVSPFRRLGRTRDEE